MKIANYFSHYMQRFVFISVYRAVLLPPSPQDTHSLHTYITRIWQQHGNNGAHIRTNAYTSAPGFVKDTSVHGMARITKEPF